MAKIREIVNSDNKLVESGATIEFKSNELVILSNALYMYYKAIEPTENMKELRIIIYTASQISQYGHLDECAVNVLSGATKEGDTV